MGRVRQGVNRERAYLTRPSTLAFSLPLPGRPKWSAHREWLTSSVNARARLPPPQVLATTILRLLYRVESGVLPMHASREDGDISFGQQHAPLDCLIVPEGVHSDRI